MSSFEIERSFCAGPVSRLLVIALATALVSLGAGWIVFELTGAFPRLAEAVKWAFLRLTDPRLVERARSKRRAKCRRC